MTIHAGEPAAPVRRPAPLDGVLDEVHLAAAEPRCSTGLHTRLRDALDGCTPGAIREAATILEALVTNAFRYAAPPYQVRLATSRGGHLIRLAVTDGTPGEADRWRLGRGLIIVRALCPQWGVEPGRTAGGKTVWAKLPVMVPPSAARHEPRIR